MVSRRATAFGMTVAAIFVAATAMEAGATDFTLKHHQWSSYHGKRHDGQRHQNDKRHGGRKLRVDIVGGNGLPSVLSGIGTYAGSIAAVRVPRNGIYFAVDRDLPFPQPTVVLEPKARIIDVSEADDDACSYEAGVCVIRLR